jgi:excisionase family DNA binding protein
MTFDELPELLTVAVAAKYLGWGKNRVRRAIEDGRLKAKRAKGSWTTIPKSEFRKFCNGDEEPAMPQRRLLY